MNTSAQASVQPASSVNMILALGSIALISGVLVVLVFQTTLPLINENKRIAIEKAIFHVLPGTHSRQDFVFTEKGNLVPSDGRVEGVSIYAGYDKQDSFIGIAAEAAAPGYQDVIRILFGYKPDCQCITGIKVLKMTETPGLGDKIATDPAFSNNFQALDVRLNDTGDGLLHAITTVKHGKKTESWQIDAISGATISSNAIGKMLNESNQYIVPLVQAHLNGFAKETPSNENTR
ncbi:MAG: FMN-binding protein [Gammaproteobacteria bacterium]